MSMKHTVVVLVLTLLLSSDLAASDVKTISGEATYYGTPNDSPASARKKALEAARIEALAKEFGTAVSHISEQQEVADSSGERSYLSYVSALEVKGEWIADVREPEYKIELDADGDYIVTCKVTITGRALSNSAPEFRTEVLRNGNDWCNADNRFHKGDDLKLRFQAPVDGFLAVYMVDDKGNVQTLLPYLSSTRGNVPITHNKDYLFFSAAGADPAFGVPDEYSLYTDKEVEHNRVYVIFSPNEFHKALDNHSGELLPRSLSYTQFAEWLSKVRRRDPQMGMKVFNIMLQ